MSQEYVTEQLGISRRAVSKWEQDLTSPDTGNLIALSALFGVSVEYLACGKEPSPIPPAQTVRPFPTSAVIGTLVIGIGLFFLVLGLLTLWLVSVLGGLMVVFGILLLTLKGKGAILTVFILVTCAVLLIAAALTCGLNFAIVLVVVAGSVGLPVLTFAIIKRIKNRRPR